MITKPPGKVFDKEKSFKCNLNIITPMASFHTDSFHPLQTLKFFNQNAITKSVRINIPP